MSVDIELFIDLFWKGIYWYESIETRHRPSETKLSNIKNDLLFYVDPLNTPTRKQPKKTIRYVGLLFSRTSATQVVTYILVFGHMTSKGQYIFCIMMYIIRGELYNLNKQKNFFFTYALYIQHIYCPYNIPHALSMQYIHTINTQNI